MKRFAYSKETVVTIPPVIIPVQVEVALRVALVQIRHVAVTITIHPDRNVQNIIYTTAP